MKRNFWCEAALLFVLPALSVLAAEPKDGATDQKAPVIASHSAARALVDNPRNLSNVELDAIKANGGVVHVTAFNPYLINPPSGYADKVRALRARHGLPAEFPAGSLGPYSGAPSLGAEHESRFLEELSALGPKASLKE